MLQLSSTATVPPQMQLGSFGHMTRAAPIICSASTTAAAHTSFRSISCHIYHPSHLLHTRQLRRFHPLDSIPPLCRIHVSSSLRTKEPTILPMIQIVYNLMHTGYRLVLAALELILLFIVYKQRRQKAVGDKSLRQRK